MEPPGRCGDWLDTATVTAQGSRSRTTRRARGGDFYLATSGDLNLATSGDFYMATDTNLRVGGAYSGSAVAGFAPGVCRSRGRRGPRTMRN